MTDAERIQHLEARVEALSVGFKSILSTFMIHGLLTKATVDHLLHEAEATLANPQGAKEYHAARTTMDDHITDARGPEPEDDHGH